MPEFLADESVDYRVVGFLRENKLNQVSEKGFFKKGRKAERTVSRNLSLLGKQKHHSKNGELKEYKIKKKERCYVEGESYN